MNQLYQNYPTRTCKANGKMLPVLKQFFNETRCVPFPEVSIPWMHNELKHSYESKTDFRFAHCAESFHKTRNNRTSEEYYLNRLYEAVVWSLIRTYLWKNNPGSAFYHASRYDDLFSSCDYIVEWAENNEELVRIDLALSQKAIRSFEENLALRTMSDKVEHFHTSSGIPEEFYSSVKPHLIQKPLPLIILRLDQSILSAFVHDYFKHISVSKTTTDILAYFNQWVDSNTSIIGIRIAYILGHVTNPSESKGVGNLATQIGILFAGINDVKTNYTS
jgi:hypothetical protein